METWSILGNLLFCALHSPWFPHTVHNSFNSWMGIFLNFGTVWACAIHKGKTVSFPNLSVDLDSSRLSWDSLCFLHPLQRGSQDAIDEDLIYCSQAHLWNRCTRWRKYRWMHDTIWSLWISLHFNLFLVLSCFRRRMKRKHLLPLHLELSVCFVWILRKPPYMGCGTMLIKVSLEVFGRWHVLLRCLNKDVGCTLFI